jgi:RNase H-fold protein (predicted Holliday junction resolvase)
LVILLLQILEEYIVVRIVLSIDPGKKKCGMAVVDNRLSFITGMVADNKELLKQIEIYRNRYKIDKIVLGCGTNSKEIYDRIKEQYPNLELTKLSEKNTTIQARRRYFEYYPPTGIAKILPVSLRIPPCPYDDFAAFVIAERYFLSQRVRTKYNNRTGKINTQIYSKEEKNIDQN